LIRSLTRRGVFEGCHHPALVAASHERAMDDESARPCLVDEVQRLAERLELANRLGQRRTVTADAPVMAHLPMFLSER
jgi:hypothetical protein